MYQIGVFCFLNTDIRQQGTVIMRHRKQVGWVLWQPQVTALWEFPQSCSGRGTQVEPSRTPELKWWSWESGETKAIRAAGQSTGKEKLHRKSTGDYGDSPEVFSRVCVRRLPEAGERTNPGDQREWCPALPQGWIWYLVPPACPENPWFTVLGRVYRRVLL